MSKLRDIQEQLQDTEAALAELERAVAGGPLPSLLSMAKSLEKRQRELKDEFNAAAKDESIKRLE